MANIIISKGTGNIVSNRIQIDMDDKIHLLDPNANPFLLITSKMGSEKISSYKPEWMEDDYVSFYGSINGAMAASETDLVVDDATLFIPGDVICCPAVTSYDNMLVTDVNTTTNVITVVRQVGGEASAPAIADNSVIARIGYAGEEGSDAAQIISTTPSPIYNYTQIFKKTFGVTETLKAIKLYGGDSLGYDRKKAGIEFEIEKEKAFIFGRRGQITTGSHPQNLMGGLIHYVTTNVVDNGGAALTEGDWDDYLDTAYLYGNTTKYTFCSSKVINSINGFAKNRLQTVSKDKTYGMDITEYISTGKKVYLIEAKKIFDTAPWNTWAITVDIEKVKQMKLRPTKLITNVQDNGEDLEKDMYISEETLKVTNEKCHAILQNVA